MSRIKQKNNLKDQYYTAPEIVDQCVRDIKKNIKMHDLWLLDSSCGNNYFAQEMGLPHISIDIDPVDCKTNSKTMDMIHGNFLTTDIQLPEKEFIMGFNPPFGLRNDLAKKFIRKLYKYKPKYLALILLNNKNWNFHGYYTIIQKKLPKNCFVFNDKAKHVPCTFFLLERVQPIDNTPTFLPKNKHYRLKTKQCTVKRGKNDTPSDYSIGVRFVGAYAGSQYYVFYKDNIFYIDYIKEQSIMVNEPKHKISNVFTLIHFHHHTHVHEMYSIIHDIYMKSHEYIDTTAIRPNFNTNDVKRIIDLILD